MDTEHAYDKMQEANRIIEDFPVGKYALYTILFLVEIAICFAIVTLYFSLGFPVRLGYIVSEVCES